MPTACCQVPKNQGAVPLLAPTPTAPLPALSSVGITHPPHAPTNVTEYLEKDFSLPIVRVNTYPTMTILDALKLSYGLIAFRKAASYLRPEKAYSLPISSMSMAMRGDMRHGARKLQLQWSSYGAKDTAGM